MRERFLLFLASLATKRTILVLVVAILLAVGSGIVAGLHLGLDSNQDNLVSTELPHHKAYMEFVDTFGDLEFLLIVIEKSPDIRKARAFARDIGKELRELPTIESVHVRFESRDFGDDLLLLAPDARIDELESELVPRAEELQAMAEIGSFADLFGLLAERMKHARPGEGEEGGLAGSFVDSALRAVEMGMEDETEPETVPSPFGAEGLSFDLPPEEAYHESGEFLLVYFMPRKDYAKLNPVEGPLRDARAALERVRNRHPEVTAGLTGRAALNADEMQSTSRDMVLAGFISLLAVSILFTAFFRRLLRPILAVVSLLLSIAWTFGLVTVTLGHLNLLSSVFAVILIGLGVDFGIHLLARYQGALNDGKASADAVRAALLTAGKGNLTAAITTAVAFYATLLTDFRGLAELGFVAGSGVLLCMLSMLLVLPAFLHLVDRNRDPETLPALPRLTFLEDRVTRPGWVLATVAAVSLLGCLTLGSVGFNQNLLELQADGVPSVTWERRLIDESNESTWITAAIADSVEEARELEAEFASLDVVARVESIASLIPADADKRRERLEAIGRRVGPLKPVPVERKVNAGSLKEALLAFSEALARLEEAAFDAGPDAAETIDQLFQLRERVDHLRTGLSKNPPRRLATVQKAYIGRIHDVLGRLHELLRPGSLSIDSFPPLIRDRLVGRDGRYAVYVYPKENVWKPEKMTRFLTSARTVDPDITGATVSVYEASRIMKSAFLEAIAYTLICVVLLLVIDFRDRWALLALLPFGLGLLWLTEAMGALGLEFNLANFFAIPILIGHGVDGGVHIMNRHREAPGKALVAHETGTGVFLSSLTTMLGFGAIGTASHRGLASLGFIMAIGAGAILIAAVVVLPCVLWCIGSQKTETREATPQPRETTSG